MQSSPRWRCLRMYIVWQSLEPSNRRAGAMASNPDISMECFQFPQCWIVSMFRLGGIPSNRKKTLQIETMVPESLTSARAIASSHRIRCRPCRPRRAKARQTTTGAGPTGAAFASPSSMIAALGSHLAAEHPIGPGGVTENEWYQNGHADQHEDLTVLRRRRLPDGDALRHDIRPHADAEPRIGQREQHEGQKERPIVLLVGEAAKQQPRHRRYSKRHRRGQDDIRPGEPAVGILDVQEGRGDADGADRAQHGEQQKP